MNTSRNNEIIRIIKNVRHCFVLIVMLIGLHVSSSISQTSSPNAKYKFDKTISREVLENFLSRSITMEGIFNGRGDLNDNIRMLTNIGAKYIGRSICLWGGEAKLMSNFERARKQVPLLIKADSDMILEACIFEIVSRR